MTPILALKDVCLSFNGIRAIENLTFEVAAGEICALIGPNGAGKSSLLNVINGVYRASAGLVQISGTDLRKSKPQEVAALGVSRTFQHNALFARLTVRENVLSGLARKSEASVLESIFRFGRAPAESRLHRSWADPVIRFVGLEHHANKIVSTLPYGLQKRVDLARALVSHPKLILLDEPMAGMNAEEKKDMARLISEVNGQFGTTVILIEHDVGIVLDLAHHVVVLDYGRKVADGRPEQIRTNPDVIAAYLGSPH